MPIAKERKINQVFWFKQVERAKKLERQGLGAVPMWYVFRTKSFGEREELGSGQPCSYPQGTPGLPKATNTHFLDVFPRQNSNSMNQTSTQSEELLSVSSASSPQLEEDLDAKEVPHPGQDLGHVYTTHSQVCLTSKMPWETQGSFVRVWLVLYGNMQNKLVLAKRQQKQGSEQQEGLGGSKQIVRVICPGPG